MSFLSIWSKSPSDVLSMSIEQIVKMAGNGKLTDGSTCSNELRTFLTQVVSEKLEEYADYCLKNKFDHNGCVLQDVVNELGRRLDHEVTNGLYQGKRNAVGNDGLWLSPEGHEILIEVKTSDAFRISLDTIARYQDRLRETDMGSPRATRSSSILIVVGREDTGGLEAQIRGSRYAWDMRLISVDALIRLVKLKESTEEAATGAKMRSTLVPMEYTRLDALIDVMFTTAKDVENVIESEAQPNPGDDEEKSGWEFTDPALIEAKRLQILEIFEKRTDTKLIRKSKALYWNANHSIRVVCTVSKHHQRGTSQFWYAYHPQWDSFLGEAKHGYFLLGCMDMKVAYAIPVGVMRQRLSELNTTPNNGKPYWHIKIIEVQKNHYALQMPKSGDHLDLKKYALKLPSA